MSQTSAKQLGIPDNAIERVLDQDKKRPSAKRRLRHIAQPSNAAIRAVMGLLILQLHKWRDLATGAYAQTPADYRQSWKDSWKMQDDAYLHFMPSAMKVFNALED